MATQNAESNVIPIERFKPEENNVQKKKKPCRRAGSAKKKIMFHTVDGRDRWVESLSSDDIQKVLKPSISFLNDTLLDKDGYSEFCSLGKDNFRVNAKKTEEG